MKLGNKFRDDAAYSGLAQDHNRSTLGYSRAIHCDTHPWSAEMVLENFIKATGRTDLLGKRFVYLTAWRNINNEPVQDNHLALLDERSLVKPDDIIVRDNFSIDAVSTISVNVIRNADLSIPMSK